MMDFTVLTKNKIDTTRLETCFPQFFHTEIPFLFPSGVSITATEKGNGDNANLNSYINVLILPGSTLEIIIVIFHLTIQ